jgi:hypothetical protein
VWATSVFTVVLRHQAIKNHVYLMNFIQTDTAKIQTLIDDDDSLQRARLASAWATSCPRATVGHLLC